MEVRLKLQFSTPKKFFKLDSDLTLTSKSLMKFDSLDSRINLKTLISDFGNSIIIYFSTPIFNNNITKYFLKWHNFIHITHRILGFVQSTPILPPGHFGRGSGPTRFAHQFVFSARSKRLIKLTDPYIQWFNCNDKIINWLDTRPNYDQVYFLLSKSSLTKPFAGHILQQFPLVAIRAEYPEGKICNLDLARIPSMRHYTITKHTRKYFFLLRVICDHTRKKRYTGNSRQRKI